MARTLSRRRSAEADEDYSRPETDEYGNDGDGDSGAVRDDRPSRRSRSARDERPSRRRSSDEDERPSRSRGRDEETSERVAGGRGFKAHATNKAKVPKNSKFNKEDRFTVELDADPVLIKFLESEPFWTWLEHWVRELGKGEKLGHVCPADDNCPLCAIDYPVAEHAAFNIAVFDKKGNASVKWWDATADPMSAIEKRADSKRTSPLDKDDLYFEVTKEKKSNGYNTFILEPVSLEIVEDEYKIDPLTEDEIDDLKKDVFTEKDILQMTPRRELAEIAAKVED